MATLALLAATAGAAASFAASPGFSGRGAGVTCIACHTPPHPVNNDARAVLDGLPEAWDLGVTYALTVRVEGGPAAMPAPAPQGGFDLSLDGGHLHILDPDLLRMHGPEEVTYNPAGTMMREWRVEWTAPTLAVQPRPVGVWLAVVAANGNHVVATNTSDQGETFDAVAAMHVEVPPSAAAVEAWRALPLVAPAAGLDFGADAAVQGRHLDANATNVGWRLDDEAWHSQETTREWTLRVSDLHPGSHRVELRSEGAGRMSPVVTLSFDTTADGAAIEHATPAPAGLSALLVALVALLALHRRKP